MGQGPTPSDAADAAFDDIFWQFPDRQNRYSSSWWFFLLFPDGETGYGPDQLMVATASRAGKSIRLNGEEYSGMDLDRPVEDGIDRFNAVSFGWHADENDVSHLLQEKAQAELSSGSHLDARDEQGQPGGRIQASDSHEHGLEAFFAGEAGRARFEAWGDCTSPLATPRASTDSDSPLGGAHLVTWPRMRFDGEFDLPGGQRELEGACYFQRVCLNVPLFPWKWLYAIFPDGTSFLAFVPYLGPQLVRDGYSFFSSDTLEQATIDLMTQAQWEWGNTGDRTMLDTIAIEPVRNRDHLSFEIEASNDADDSLTCTAEPYNHVRNSLERQLIGGLSSHYSHNEYPFRITDLDGEIDGRPLDASTLGQGFGNLEYTWGLGL